MVFAFSFAWSCGLGAGFSEARAETEATPAEPVVDDVASPTRAESDAAVAESATAPKQDQSQEANAGIVAGADAQTKSAPPTLAPSDARLSLNRAIAALKTDDFSTARAQLQAALKAEPNCVSCLYNLGLTEFRDGKVGLAAGLWRKALSRAPSYQPARYAMDWATKRLDRRDPSGDPGALEWAWSAILSVNPWLLALASAALFAAAGWSVIERAARRKARLEADPDADDEDAGEFPWAPLAFGLVSIALAFAAASRVARDVQPRATVIAAKVPALSAPDQGAAPLFDLFEGSEVLVRQSKDGWSQVERAGGAVGWAPNSALYF